MSKTNEENIDQKLVEEFQDVIVEVFQVLRTFGIEELHVGGIMRLLGVSPEVAELYDNHIMVASELDENSEGTPNNYKDFDLQNIPESKIVKNSNTKLH